MDDKLERYNNLLQLLVIVAMNDFWWHFDSQPLFEDLRKTIKN